MPTEPTPVAYHSFLMNGMRFENVDFDFLFCRSNQIPLESY